MEELKTLYNTRAPRWVKVIRWREIFDRWVNKHRLLFPVFTFPVIIGLITQVDFYPMYIAINQPKDEEELLKLKQNWNTRLYARPPDSKPGQYYNDTVPFFDLAERRKKYPQYYEGRYDGFKKYYV